jgi:hypothetical protein
MARKYVMATNADGLSDVIIDEEVADGSIVDLWINFETPADLNGREDPTKSGTLFHEPPDGGAIFRVVKFTKEMNLITPEQMYAMHQQINSVHVPSIEYLRAAKHPSMHKTDTLNYFVLVSGRLWALTEGRDVLLKPGDYIIQKGCIHGWKVESDEPCLLAAILIDAQPS